MIPMSLETTRPDNCNAVIAMYMGREITDPEEALRLRTQSEYLPTYAYGDNRTVRKYKCPYCDVWSDNNIGVCEHCGAPKE